jgi:hypothetical protein
VRRHARVQSGRCVKKWSVKCQSTTLSGILERACVCIVRGTLRIRTSSPVSSEDGTTRTFRFGGNSPVVTRAGASSDLPAMAHKRVMRAHR